MAPHGYPPEPKAVHASSGANGAESSSNTWSFAGSGGMSHSTEAASKRDGGLATGRSTCSG